MNGPLGVTTSLGYANLYGPILYPALEWAAHRRHRVSLGVHYSPAVGGSAIVNFASYALEARGQWQFAWKKEWEPMAEAYYSLTRVNVSSNDILVSQYGLRLGVTY